MRAAMSASPGSAVATNVPRPRGGRPARAKRLLPLRAPPRMKSDEATGPGSSREDRRDRDARAGRSPGSRIVLLPAPSQPRGPVAVAGFVPDYSDGDAADSHRLPWTPPGGARARNSVRRLADRTPNRNSRGWSRASRVRSGLLVLVRVRDGQARAGVGLNAVGRHRVPQPVLGQRGQTVDAPGEKARG